MTKRSISWYWTTLRTQNLPPALIKPPVDLFAKVGTAFVHRLSDSTFADPDGRIATVTFAGLPGGLQSDGTLIFGTPTKAGSYDVTATATDNSGATTAANFKIIVSADNLPPVVQSKIPDQSVEVNTAYSYTIPANTFSDPDGTIASIEVLGLPEGITFTGSTLSGSPTKVGEYQLIATAKDDAGATVQLPFRLSVKGKNRAPLVARAINDKTIPLGFPYRFVIPEGTFFDIEGEVTRLTITGLPAGLTASADTVSGVPTKIGQSIVIVTAFDDKGLSTQLTFRLIVVENQPPLVAKAIGDQTVALGAFYRFVVPAGTFIDTDGYVASLEISGLPKGLAATGDTISGKPTETGVFEVKITAIDDKGTSVSLTYKLTVPGNQAPSVGRTTKDQTSTLGSDYRLVVPAGTFVDRDGSIARLEISGLPQGLTASGDTISGRSTEVGVFEVKITAFDDKDESVALTFKLTVPGNETPVVAKVIGDQSVDVDVAYRFVIPAGTFADPDGSIARIEIAGLPRGLAAKGDTISGKPTETGDFSISVKAFDDRGASVVLTFKLTVRSVATPPTAAAIPDLVAIAGQVFRIGAEEAPASASGVAPWVAYPNPFKDKVRVSIGNSAPPKAVELVSVGGRNLGLSASSWSVERSTLTVDLTGRATTPGIYLLRLTDAKDQVRVLRIMKSDQR